MKYCAVYLIQQCRLLSLLTSSVSKDNVVHTEEKKKTGIFKRNKKENDTEETQMSFPFLLFFLCFVISQVTGETSGKKRTVRE